MHTSFRILLIIGLVFGAVFVSLGQTRANKNLEHELRATTVNDSYFALRQDYYYTNGLQIGYSRLLDQRFSMLGLIPEENRKTIFNIKLAHQVYTPKFIQNPMPDLMDRPYAGYLYAQGRLNSFWKQKNNLNVALTLGVIGPASGAEQMQRKWHEFFGLPIPKGWEYQIRNEPVVNLNAKYRRSWFLSSEVDAIAGTGFRAGTAFNDLSAGVTFRFGNIHPLDQSAISNSHLGGSSDSNSQYHDNEWFLFFGWENKLVIHNTLIDGGLISPSQSSLDRESEPYVSTIKWGGAYSLSAITWKLVMSQISPEVVGAEKHILVSFDMAVRF
ncbi:MAG: lipid A deacylase LpxR family protein [Balneolaceae bacterium]|nr:lipid A deacylase LpxR family protein [Balneolaceae bacterium]